MRAFLQRISSRKFLTALAVQVAGVLALFFPAKEQTIYSTAVQISALAAILLAALGYGRIESAVDKQFSNDTNPPPGETQ